MSREIVSIRDLRMFVFSCAAGGVVYTIAAGRFAALAQAPDSGGEDTSMSIFKGHLEGWGSNSGWAHSSALGFHRRGFMKWLAAGPVFGIIVGRGAVQKLVAAHRSSSANVYHRIGVRPFINGRGTWTYLSGSLELPAVRRAKEAAAQHFVDMFELQHAVGKRLAQLSGAESGMVTSGAAGAMLQPPLPRAWRAPIRRRSGSCRIPPV